MGYWRQDVLNLDANVEGFMNYMIVEWTFSTEKLISGNSIEYPQRTYVFFCWKQRKLATRISITVYSRYLEFQGTEQNMSRYQ